jgi:hypothetical protein
MHRFGLLDIRILLFLETYFFFFLHASIDVLELWFRFCYDLLLVIDLKRIKSAS